MCIKAKELFNINFENIQNDVVSFDSNLEEDLTKEENNITIPRTSNGPKDASSYIPNNSPN